jgi:hypothetical protein
MYSAEPHPLDTSVLVMWFYEQEFPCFLKMFSAPISLPYTLPPSHLIKRCCSLFDCTPDSCPMPRIAKFVRWSRIILLHAKDVKELDYSLHYQGLYRSDLNPQTSKNIYRQRFQPPPLCQKDAPLPLHE